MASAVTGPSRRTRFLILADTHGAYYLPDTKELQPIDVVIHCGDITADSQLSEYKTAIHLLSQIDAPLKLVIAGNHDFTLDTPTYKRMLHKARRCRNFSELLRTHGQPGDARSFFEHARRPPQGDEEQQQQQRDSVDINADDAHHHHSSNNNNNDNNKATGIHYLDEGTYRFRLANSTTLTVYASPYTPAYGTPGFQYPAARPGPESGKEGGAHEFSVPDDADVVITHGPPHGVLDRSWAPPALLSIGGGGGGGAGRSRHVGSTELFTAVARARPRMHCFGHIHEGWGAEVVRWGKPPELENEERHGGSRSQRGGSGSGSGLGSTVIADLGSVLPLKGDSPEVVAEKEGRLREYAAGKCVKTSHCAGDALPVEKGENTLFVNAAVAGQPVQPAWVVDLELPVAADDDARFSSDGQNYDQ
ncbi:hypothetical protein VTG60DRAFT_2141 [Thermothelomyces hinnuleus]